MTSGFYDGYGMPHPSPYEISDNGELFMVEDKKLADAIGEEYDDSHFLRTIRAHEIKTGVYAQVPGKVYDPSSHDNTTGRVGWLYENGHIEEIRKLKVLFRFNHPRDFAFYWWCKKGVYRWLLAWPWMWFLYLAQVSACRDVYQYNKNRNLNIVDTSGKKLAWVRMQTTMKDSWLMRKCWVVCSEIISKHKEIKDYERGGVADISDWGKIFSYYHSNPQMPCHIKAVKYSEILNRGKNEIN